MPAARGLLRRDQNRKPSGRRGHDQDAGRCLRRGDRQRRLPQGSARRACMNQVAPMLAAARAPSLQAVGMTKIFGPLVALDDVSINVPAGSFHALLGENGAGKSTLVKSIMGFYAPDKGQVLLDGKE